MGSVMASDHEYERDWPNILLALALSLLSAAIALIFIYTLAYWIPRLVA